MCGTSTSESQGAGLRTSALVSRALGRTPGVKPVLRRLARAAVATILRARSRLGPPRPAAGRTVIVSPHPDDAEFGCAGLIWTRRCQGAEVSVVCVTDGAGSHRGHPRLTAGEVVAARKRETTAALALLGCDPSGIRFLDAPDGHLALLAPSALAELATGLAAVLDEWAPAELLFPLRSDLSADHAAVHDLTRAAVAATNVQPQLLAYPVWSWWNPLLLIGPAFRRERVWRLPLSAAARAAKSRAIAEHRSQVEPTAPWTSAVLPHGFVDGLTGPDEYFFAL